jgi:hypothetical protein
MRLMYSSSFTLVLKLVCAKAALLLRPLAPR